MIDKIDLVSGRVLLSTGNTELFSLSNTLIAFRQNLALNKVMVSKDSYEKTNQVIELDINLIKNWFIDGIDQGEPASIELKWKAITNDYFGKAGDDVSQAILAEVTQKAWTMKQALGTNGAPVVLPAGVLSFTIINDQAIGQGAAQDIDISIATGPVTNFTIDKALQQVGSSGLGIFAKTGEAITITPQSTGTCTVYYSIEA